MDSVIENIDPSPLLGSVYNDIAHHEESNVTHDNDGAVLQSETEQCCDDTNVNSNSANAKTQNKTRQTWSIRTHVSELSSTFSWQFISWLAIDQYFVTGGTYSIVQAVGLPLVKSLGIDATRQQLYSSLIMSPWAMKPFVGVASDLFPIQGYNKRYFAIYSILIGLIGSAALMTLLDSETMDRAVQQGASAVQHLGDLIILCFTAVSYEAATLDILGEGKCAELINLRPESGSSIISFKFWWSFVGGIITQSFVSPLSDAGYYFVLISTVLCLSITPLYPTLAGWIPEKRRTSNEPGFVKLCWGCMFDKESFEAKKSTFIIIVLCGLSSPLVAAVTTYADLEIGLAVATALISLFLLATFCLFPKTFFWVFLSVVTSTLSTISIGSALGYYYSASEECVPDGPNFDYTYYITVTGVGGCIVNLLAVMMYQRFLRCWRYQPVLIMIKLICAMTSFIELAIVLRWNTLVGIPDKIMFLFANLRKLNKCLLLMPMSSIYAKISPPGMESAVVVGIPVTFLIPNVLQSEKIIDWDKEKWFTERDSYNKGKLGNDMKEYDVEKHGDQHSREVPCEKCIC